MSVSVPGIVVQETALYESSQAELALEKQIAQEQLMQRREELVEVKARERQAAQHVEVLHERDRLVPGADAGEGRAPDFTIGKLTPISVGQNFLAGAVGSTGI